MAKRNYDEEFKRDAVELLLSGAKELKPLARDLGVCPATLRGWRPLPAGTRALPRPPAISHSWLDRSCSISADSIGKVVKSMKVRSIDFLMWSFFR
ncbi:MAG: transposase [Candidatus Hydrogenedentales bacterium]